MRFSTTLHCCLLIIFLGVSPLQALDFKDTEKLDSIFNQMRPLVYYPPLKFAKTSGAVIIAHCEYDKMDFKSDRGELAPFNEEIPVTGTISILKQLNGPPLPNRIHLDLRLKKRLDWGGDLFTQYKLSARRAVYDFYGSVDPNDTSKEPSVMALLDKYWVEHMTRDEVSQQLIDAEMIKCVSESDLLADAQRNIDKPYFVYCLLYESFEKGDIKEPSTVSKLLFMFSSAPEMNSQIKALALCKGNAAIQASILHKIDIELLDSKMPDDAFITSRAILLCAMDSAMNSEADTKTLFSEVNNRSIALMHAKGW